MTRNLIAIRRASTSSCGLRNAIKSTTNQAVRSCTVFRLRTGHEFINRKQPEGFGGLARVKEMKGTLEAR